MIDLKDSVEYRMISEFYSNRTAVRSGVKLMNHIDEGLIILDEIEASDYGKKAFCLHPLLQADADLKNHFTMVLAYTDPMTLLLAMEYRNIANSYLSDKIDTEWNLTLSPLPEVNKMLVADKVQNRKDFLKYHYGTHPRSNQLARYFNKWLSALEVSDAMYVTLCEKINNYTV